MPSKFRTRLQMLLPFAIAVLLHAASASPENFHRRLSRDQLRKYFGVDSHDQVPEYSVSSFRFREHEPGELWVRAESVLGRSLQVRLDRNERLLAPAFSAVRLDEGGREVALSPRTPGCHFVDRNGTAALSSCGHTPGLRGILLLPEGGVQVQPLEEELLESLGLATAQQKRDRGGDQELLHLLFRPDKRLSVPDEDWRDVPSSPRSEYELDDDDILRYIEDLDVPGEPSEPKDKRRILSSKELFLELALFFDEKAYDLFLPHVRSEDALLDLILGFVNQMQAVYQQPSLSRKIQISLVRLELLKKQPADLPHQDGERDKLLDAFCAYQAKKNPDSDKDPNHWDIGLYISGLNFYAMEKGKKSGITMGLAPVGGVCMKQHACVITEFGTTADDGRPYPSAGLLSTYVAAHEIGHNLGMFHDGPPNNKCPANGHVMSPSRGTKGETTWSSCSAKLLEKTDKKCLLDAPQSKSGREHAKFKERPGQVWDAHDQCRLFLRDRDAALLNDTVLSMVCEETLCKSPHRIGYYAAGPALEGTFCGGKKWCEGGRCVSWGSEKVSVVVGGWSKWQKGECTAGCIHKSRGVVADKRFCDNPKPRNTEKLCEGDNLRIHFCDDSKLCKSRASPSEFAKQRCEYFSTFFPEITPVGVQVKYNEKREWQSCAVYCKTKSGTWYTPRQEFNDMGVDTFFPDGTWCHADARADFFCQNRLCLPPPSAQGRSLLPGAPSRGGPEVDVPVLNNARPKGGNRAPKKLREYFQWREGRLPPMPGPEDLGRPKEEDYEIVDYVAPRTL